jgi:hypothetical protein
MLGAGCQEHKNRSATALANSMSTATDGVAARSGLRACEACPTPDVCLRRIGCERQRRSLSAHAAAILATAKMAAERRAADKSFERDFADQVEPIAPWIGISVAASIVAALLFVAITYYCATH